MNVLRLDDGPLLLGLRAQSGTLCQQPKCFRIGVVVDGTSVQRWVREVVTWLSAISLFDVRLYSPQADASRQDHASRMFECFYHHSCHVFDPFHRVTLPLEHAVLSPLGPKTECHLQQSAPCGNSKDTLEVLLWLAAAPMPSGGCSDLARFGTISVEPGINQHFPPYWDEVFRGELLSRATLWWHESTFERARQLRTAQISTDQGFRFTRNAEGPLSAIAQMIACICVEMLSDIAGWIARNRRIPEQDRPFSRWSSKAPSGLESTTFLCRKFLRSLRLRARDSRKGMGWFVAIRPNDSRSYINSNRFVAEGLRELPLAPRSQMADPFLLEYEDRTYLYFEEVPAGNSKGRLSCVEVREDGTITDPVVVLEAGGHLSYPCVFKHQDELFMIPESSYNCRVDLYRASRPTGEFRLETTYTNHLAATDTTPFLLDGKWYFFTTTVGPFMQTLLFWSDHLDGKWRLHANSPVSCSAQNSRSAGAIKIVNGHILRPTQDCSVRYGYAITVNEVCKLTPTEFEEHKIDVILPSWNRRLLGIHTWNHSSRFEVFDGRKYLL